MRTPPRVHACTASVPGAERTRVLALTYAGEILCKSEEEEEGEKEEGEKLSKTCSQI